MKKRLMAVAAGLVLSMAAVSATAFEYMWYDNLGRWMDPTYIDEASCPTALSYNDGYDNIARITAYLDNANARGMKVILSCKELLLDMKAGKPGRDSTYFANYIQTFNSHPALKGWYLADEPTDNSLLSVCQTGYNVIHGYNNPKPVYMAFEKTGVGMNAPSNYQNTYDVMMYDMYPFGTGEPEFDHFEDQPNWPGFKSLCQTAINQAKSLNKPFVNILQAFKRWSPDHGYLTDYYRLPTYKEERFMTFWSAVKGAGVAYWAMQILDEGIADPVDPSKPVYDVYPYSPTQWRSDVANPLGQELEKLQDALGAGAISGLSDNQSSVLSNVYRDPKTGKYYLLAVNSGSTGRNTRFYINPSDPSFSGFDFTKAEAIRLDGSDEFMLAKDYLGRWYFNDTFTSYGVGTYELVPEPATITLLLTGAALWLFWRCRKRAAV